MINWEQFKNKDEAIKFLRATKDQTCRTNADALKYMREHIPEEGYYQKKIMERIKKLVPEAFVWKAAAGPYSRGGVPDVCAVINGRFYGFEVKRPFIGVLSKLQEKTIREIQKAGGKAYVVTFPDEITRILRAHKEVAGDEE